VLRFRQDQALRHYRHARSVAARAEPGEASTEELRAGFLSARSLCEMLTGDAGEMPAQAAQERIDAGQDRIEAGPAEVNRRAS
jgi:hypothetical protein